MTVGCAAEDDMRDSGGGPGVSSFGGSEGESGGGAGEGSEGGGTSAGSASGSSAESADDDAADQADGPAFDLGSADGETDAPIPEAGCTAVDFLFVIDNSVSMENNQASLVGAFPGFIASIQATLEADSDYHIMVADTDAWGRCNTVDGWNGIDPGSGTCNNYIKNTSFVECDRTLGGGVIHPAGQHASNMPCNPAGGHRYIEPGEADLPGTFACMATVGVAGHSSERPMDAMIAALAPGINAVGGCNEGFLREDALLVITFMSDDPNYEDADGPVEWTQAVLDAKGGDPSRVVVMGLTPDWPGCGGGNPGGAHWSEFIASFGANGVHGDICGTAADFIAFFDASVATIDQACDDFEPPG